MPEKLPHPTNVADLDRARTDFVFVTETRSPDPAWHFELGVHKSSSSGEPAELAPEPADPVQSLGLFHRETPPGEVEVIGLLMPFEIDAQHWLEEEMEEQGKDVLSSKPVMLNGGLQGDVLASWEDDEGGAFVGRYVASKWGPRIFCVACRSTLEDYPKLADDFFLSIASFQAVDQSHGPLAERVHTVRGETPTPWKVAVPESWIVQMDPEDPPRFAGFTAAQVPFEPVDADTLVGKLSFAVFSRASMRVPRSAAQAFLDVLKQNDFEIEDKDFEDEPSRPPFQRSWLLVAEATREETLHEVRCRVMLHERAWIIAGVVGPVRQDGALAWMRNKRALDVVTSTLVMRT